MYSTRISLSLIAGASRPSGVLEIAVHEERGDERRCRRGHEHRVAHPLGARPDAEERRGQDVEAVGGAERLALHEQAVENHGEREAEQPEEDAAVAREQETEHERRRRRHRAADQHLDEDVRDAEEAAEGAGGVGAEAVEERLAEGNEPRAQQEQQAQHHSPRAKAMVMMNIAHCGSHGPVNDQERKQSQKEQRASAPRIHIFLGSARLKSPRGRTASTAAMTK